MVRLEIRARRIWGVLNDSAPSVYLSHNVSATVHLTQSHVPSFVLFLLVSSLPPNLRCCALASR